MAVSGNSIAIKSFQSFQVNEGLLQKVLEATVKGEKDARSSGEVRSFEVFYHGFRQNISIGKLFIVPASVCNKPEEFPIALLYGTVVRLLNLGEETADLIQLRTGGEFDDTTDVEGHLKALKERAFTVDGKETSLIVFAPAWGGIREYVCFQFTDDEAKLVNLLRHLVFSCYFNPAVSSGFDALMTVADTWKLDVTDITPKLTYPALTENPMKAYPELLKSASGRRRIFLTAKTADAIAKEQVEPAEMDVFQALGDALGGALKHETTAPAEVAEKDYKTPEAGAEVPRADDGTGPIKKEGRYLLIDEARAMAEDGHTDARLGTDGVPLEKGVKAAGGLPAKPAGPVRPAKETATSPQDKPYVVKQNDQIKHGPCSMDECLDFILEDSGNGIGLSRGGYEIEEAGQEIYPEEPPSQVHDLSLGGYPEDKVCPECKGDNTGPGTGGSLYCSDCGKVTRHRSAASKTADTADNPSNEKGGVDPIHPKTDAEKANTRGETPEMAPEGKVAYHDPWPGPQDQNAVRQNQEEPFVVRYGTATNALGKKTSGWYVLDGKQIQGVVSATAEDAVKQAKGIADMRRAGYGPRPVKVIYQDGTEKMASFAKVAYVSHCPGHKNSKGELAEWCVKSHGDDHIISSHGSEEAAKKHLQDMHAHSGAKQAYGVHPSDCTCGFCEKKGDIGGKKDDKKEDKKDASAKTADTADNPANQTKDGDGAMDPKTGKDKPVTATAKVAEAQMKCPWCKQTTHKPMPESPEFKCPCGWSSEKDGQTETSKRGTLKTAADDRWKAQQALHAIGEFYTVMPDYRSPTEALEQAIAELEGTADPALESASLDLERGAGSPDFGSAMDWVNSAKSKLERFLKEGQTMTPAGNIETGADMVADEIARPMNDGGIVASSKSREAARKYEAWLRKNRRDGVQEFGDIFAEAMERHRPKKADQSIAPDIAEAKSEIEGEGKADLANTPASTQTTDACELAGQKASPDQGGVPRLAGDINISVSTDTAKSKVKSKLPLGDGDKKDKKKDGKKKADQDVQPDIASAKEKLDHGAKSSLSNNPESVQTVNPIDLDKKAMLARKRAALENIGKKTNMLIEINSRQRELRNELGPMWQSMDNPKVAAWWRLWEAFKALPWSESEEGPAYPGTGSSQERLAGKKADLGSAGGLMEKRDGLFAMMKDTQDPARRMTIKRQLEGVNRVIGNETAADLSSRSVPTSSWGKMTSGKGPKAADQGVSPDVAEAKSEIMGQSKSELADSPEATQTVNPIDLDKKADGPYTKKKEPCGNYEPAQEPRTRTTVCYNCGWVKSKHNPTGKQACAPVGDDLDETIEMELGFGDLADLGANLPDVVDPEEVYKTVQEGEGGLNNEPAAKKAGQFSEGFPDEWGRTDPKDAEKYQHIGQLLMGLWRGGDDSAALHELATYGCLVEGQSPEDREIAVKLRDQHKQHTDPSARTVTEGM